MNTEVDPLAPQTFDHSILESVLLNRRDKRIEIRYRDNSVLTITPMLNMSQNGIEPDYRVNKSHRIPLGEEAPIRLYAEELLDEYISKVDPENKESLNMWLDKVVKWKENRELKAEQ